MTNKQKLNKGYEEHCALVEQVGRKTLPFSKWKKLARKNKKPQVVKIKGD